MLPRACVWRALSWTPPRGAAWTFSPTVRDVFAVAEDGGLHALIRGTAGTACLQLTPPPALCLATQAGAAIIVYTGNWLSDEVPGKNGTLYKPHDAVAIEVSPSFPNAVNTPTFPSIFVEPGQVYEHTAVWRFYNATT